MASAAERGWGSPGAPGTPSAAQYRKQHIVTIDVGGIRLAVRREVAPLFAGFIRDIVKQGYDLTQHADDWGYICRYIRGYEAQQILSNHAWGLAIDLNAAEHPMGKRGTGVPAFVVEAAHRWGLFWGGDYKSRPDEMHFEFLGTPADAARIATTAHTTPAPAPQEDDMTPEQARKLDEIHNALFTGVPTMGVAPVVQTLTEIGYNVAGIDLPKKPSRIKQLLLKAGITV